MRVTVDVHRRIVLAPEIGAEPGDEIVFEKRGDEWVLRIEKLEPGLEYRDGIVVHPGKCTEPLGDPVEKDREERLNQLSGGTSR